MGEYHVSNQSADPLPYFGLPMEKISAGEYTYNEFHDLVIRWRKKYAVNELAVYPPIVNLRYIDNMRITHHKDGVRLEKVE